MSIFQNTYFIVPRNGNYDLFEDLNLKSFLEEEGLFDDDLFWEGLNYKYEKYKDYLMNIFEVGDSWSKKVKIFGNNDTNCLKLFVEEGFILSVSFRVNFKTDYAEFLRQVIEFCKINDYLVVDNKLDVLSLDFETINYNIINSTAFKRFNDFFTDG
ncbi:hypothetical protein [uncultured Psychroserpens sp.]|uniref:hypothetical protein n=1 Tax=uncultured Psychroserpens sp. TaxID=255436 RepID=UPI002609DDC2|nr:hypothetical protein [uncultured Psychroserpens sp.]